MVSGNSKHTYAIRYHKIWLKNAIKCSFKKVTLWSDFTEFSHFGHITNAVIPIRLCSGPGSLGPLASLCPPFRSFPKIHPKLSIESSLRHVLTHLTFFILKVATRWRYWVAQFDHLLGSLRSVSIFKDGIFTAWSDITEPVKCFEFPDIFSFFQNFCLVYLHWYWAVWTHNHPCWCWPARRATLSGDPGQFLKASNLFHKHLCSSKTDYIWRETLFDTKAAAVSSLCVRAKRYFLMYIGFLALQF